eukprot:1849505-Rhodomonas_salina.1
MAVPEAAWRVRRQKQQLRYVSAGHCMALRRQKQQLCYGSTGHRVATGRRIARARWVPKQFSDVGVHPVVHSVVERW